MWSYSFVISSADVDFVLVGTAGCVEQSFNCSTMSSTSCSLSCRAVVLCSMSWICSLYCVAECVCVYLVSRWALLSFVASVSMVDTRCTNSLVSPSRWVFCNWRACISFRCSALSRCNNVISSSISWSFLVTFVSSSSTYVYFFPISSPILPTRSSKAFPARWTLPMDASASSFQVVSSFFRAIISMT